MSNTAVVKEMYHQFANKDYDALRNLIDENVKWNQMKGFPGGGQYVGLDNVIKFVFNGFKDNWINWKATIERYVEAENSVFVIGYYEGTYKSTNKYMQSDFNCEYKIENGKIIEFNQYTDTFNIAKAMI